MNVGLEGVKQEIESTTACCASTFMWNMVEASNNPHRDSTIEFRRLWQNRSSTGIRIPESQHRTYCRGDNSKGQNRTYCG